MWNFRLYLLFSSASVAILAFAILNFWHDRNAPLHKKFESAWSQDIGLLEASGKLPKSWQDIREIEVTGGTPETRDWLARIQLPQLPSKNDGHHKLEVLVVVWEEDGKRGALVQYNLVNLRTGNMIWELGRTFILNDRKPISKLF